MVKNSVISTIYIILIFLIPVLSQYAIGGLDLDVIVMSVLFIVLVFGYSIGIKKSRAFTFFIFYSIAITLINLLCGNLFAKPIEIMLRLIKFVLYISITVFLGLEQLITYERGIKIYRVIAIIATTYILIQAFFYYFFGITLPNKIGANLSEINPEEVGRLRSFYSEPSVMAYCNVPFICCALFGERYGERDTRLRDAIFVSIGILLSTSGQGIICTLVIWGVWIIHGIITGKIKFKEVCTIVLVVILGMALYFSGILEFAFNRISDTGEYGAIAARAGGYKSLSLLSVPQLIFGAGYGNYVTKNVYGLEVPYEFVNYSSFAENLFVIGIVGSLLLYGTLFIGALKGDIRAKMIFLVILVLSVSGSPLSSVHLPMYLSFLFLKQPSNSKSMMNEV